MPFDDDEQAPPQPKVGVKLKNSNSIFSNNINKKDQKEEFEKKADQANKQSLAYNTRAMEAALKFKKILEDKSLLENKDIFSKDIEKEIIGELIQLGNDINIDENEIEGAGSQGLIALLFKTALIQRDKINTLEYNVSVLQKQLKKIQESTEDKK